MRRREGTGIHSGVSNSLTESVKQDCARSEEGGRGINSCPGAKSLYAVPRLAGDGARRTSALALREWAQAQRHELLPDSFPFPEFPVLSHAEALDGRPERLRALKGGSASLAARLRCALYSPGERTLVTAETTLETWNTAARPGRPASPRPAPHNNEESARSRSLPAPSLTQNL